MKKKYPLKPTSKQLEVMREGWKQMILDYDKFWGLVQSTEKWMQKESGIKDLEFIKDDMCGEWVGIGNVSKSLRLYQREELE